MIAIIDYGMGNLRSVQKAFEKVGAHAQITHTPADILKADRVVLPGVGAMAPAMQRLHELGLTDVIRRVTKEGKPFLGICLGLQVGVIAAARRGGLENATTTEIEPDTESPVIYMMYDQINKQSTGGTMRLGNHYALLQTDSIVYQLYGREVITERHRHRYEVNTSYERYYTAGGIRVSGTSPDEVLVEFIEGTDHPYFIATQAHPEFRSRPLMPHPLFVGFIEAMMNRGK